MAEDGARARAAEYIDAEFGEQRQALAMAHRRHERWQLALHKTQLEAFARNREDAEARYVERLKRIERGYERASLAIQKRHNSIGGRLERLTKAGRDRQAATFEALDERKVQLDTKATANLNQLRERQFTAEQRDRISRARELKLIRLDNLDLRREQANHQAESRGRKIEERAQLNQRAQAEQAWQQTMQRERSHARTR